MSEAIWALIGVVVGVAATGIFNLRIQSRQFNHDKEMFRLKNQSAENVKALLRETLSHPNYTDRSFAAIKKRVGGYSDEEIKQLLHEVDAKRTSRNDGTEEWWYLSEREAERNEKRTYRAD
jgi:uncharacterized protein HemX